MRSRRRLPAPVRIKARTLAPPHGGASLYERRTRSARSDSPPTCPAGEAADCPGLVSARPGSRPSPTISARARSRASDEPRALGRLCEPRRPAGLPPGRGRAHVSHEAPSDSEPSEPRGLPGCPSVRTSPASCRGRAGCGHPRGPVVSRGPDHRMAWPAASATRPTLCARRSCRLISLAAPHRDELGGAVEAARA
jgi:hypothetical protein